VNLNTYFPLFIVPVHCKYSEQCFGGHTALVLLITQCNKVCLLGKKEAGELVSDQLAPFPRLSAHPARHTLHLNP